MSADLEEVARLIARRYISRPDVKAVQTQRGTYFPDRQNPFTIGDIVDHILGRKTYGHYMVGSDNMTKLAVFDIDMGKSQLAHRGQKFFPREAMFNVNHPMRPFCVKLLRTVADGLSAFAHRYIARSHCITAYSGGKGMHVYVILPRKTHAQIVRTALLEIMAGPLHPFWLPSRGENFYRYADDVTFPEIEIELFPKQDNPTDLGNLLRLPLGLHLKSRNRAYFVDTAAPVDQLIELDPLEALSWTKK